MQSENRKHRVLKAGLALLLCLMLAAGALLPTLAATGKIKALKVSAATESTITLKWSTVKGANRYQLQQYKDKQWTKIASTAKNTYQVKQLSAGTTYAFRVRALKEKQKGAFSETLKARTAPARVENVAAKRAKPTSVKLQWDKVRGAEGYRVQQYVDKAWVTVAKTEKQSATIKNLPENTVLSFRVAAFLTSGSKTVFGKNSAVCKAKTTLTPEPAPQPQDEPLTDSDNPNDSPDAEERPFEYYFPALRDPKYRDDEEYYLAFADMIQHPQMKGAFVLSCEEDYLGNGIWKITLHTDRGDYVKMFDVNGYKEEILPPGM